MIRAIIFLLVGAFATPGFGQDSGELSPNTSEHLFSCGAAFFTMAKVYEGAGDAKKSAVYRRKFDTLAGQAEDVYEQSRRSKSDAEIYMQDHLNRLAGVGEKDTQLIFKWVRDCDQRFPDPNSTGPIISILPKAVP